MLKVFEKIGDECLYFLEQAGRMGIFLGACLVSILRPPYKIFPIVRQVQFIGAKSVFVILFTGAFTGMVLGLQGYYTLSKFGSEGLLGSAVALSLIRELGPVVAALMVIGRAGSAICAEIGIMRNSEQIDALECMAVDPFKYLMAPKLVAGVISMPLLTFIFDVVGILGGYLIGVLLLGASEGNYFQNMYTSVEWADIRMGVVKSLVFGLLLVWIAAAKGYNLHLERNGGFGAEGVSRTTTDAVVLSSVSVLVWDYLISAILL
ncbi:ABC transporter permease [Desulfuromonas versatilis]|uniref:ABC transporter permease n=1 Tax=Desulfuromonas versatilis TaxID=2802975 RepID=A0ABN6DZU5_9BACT|nr:MlaE family lipid ABC transporter permease subunit [Desulfuromonas versatilis]BCR05630.1 ABC transporter permease [Desulfuromonas versatilis]